jgi:hypothetical protein
MTNITKKFVAGFAAVALLASSFSGVALAGTTIEISGNGAGSDNWANVSQTSETTVTQNNTANVTNTVDSNANTGGNDANLNTGGDVMIKTGNASTDSSVTNVLNSNSADVDCCASGETEVKISGNGAGSDNTVLLGQDSKTTVKQTNNATVTNTVNSDAKTGYNDANSNVGGDVYIKTGDASVVASVSTLANVNSARVSGSQHGAYPTAAFWITGNGAGSDNYIGAELDKTTAVTQGNTAKVTNDVDADAKTGGNDANLNVGGDVIIDTGDAEIEAMVDNAVNFNYADVDCGCTWDVMAKISGNGAEADSHHKYGRHHKDKGDNVITLELGSLQTVGQTNNASLYNYLDDLEAKTGYNEASSNGGEYADDPSITTGNASVTSGVSNEGNVNSVGPMSGWEMPGMPEVDFSFNFAAMMAFFGFWM